LEGPGTENRYLFVRASIDPELETPPAEATVEEDDPNESEIETAPEGESGDDLAANDEDSGEDAEVADAAADDEAAKEAAKKAREEWEKKLEAAKKRVDELNLRFGKWYYVIEGNSFTKLRKTRAELVQPKLPDTTTIGEQPDEGRTPIKRPSGLAYYELEYGKGKAAVDGDTVKVLYTGWLKDGTEFDKADDREKPFIFVLGEETVIEGWEEGIRGMRLGGKRKLIIPPELGYGEAGSGGAVPPNAFLIFDVELIDAKKDE
jgi:peptidylprolyl isomerase